MLARGVASHIDADSVVLSMEVRDKGRCATCGCCAVDGRDRLLTLKKSEHPQLAQVDKGDTVELDLNLPNPGVAAAIIFGLPIFDMVLGAVLGSVLFDNSAKALVLGGVAGFMLGLLQVFIINRALARRGIGIKVVRVIRV